MASALEPAFASGRPVWPLAGKALADLEPDDPDLAIPHGALQNGGREAPERYLAANRNGLITHTPAEPLAPSSERTTDLHRKWKFALLASLIFHAAIALFFIHAVDDDVLMEGAEFSGIAFLGSAEDQVQAGEISQTEPAVDVTMVTMLDAVPVETVEAEAVPVDDTVEAVEVTEAVTAEPETVQPVEAAPAERVTAEPLAPSPTQRVEPETAESLPSPSIAEIVPEVLATDRAELVDDDNFVQKPAETQAAEPVEAAETASAERVESARTEQAEAAEAAKAEPQEATKVETAEVATAEQTEAEPIQPVEDVKPKPVEKAAPEKPAREAPKKVAEEKKPAARKKAEEPRKVVEKAEPKPRKAGNGGQNQANARRGQADGQEKGDNRQASRGGSKSGKVGNAAVSNYPGKVRSKLARAARSVRARGRGEVIVAFAVGSNGGVRSARVTRSSGVDSVDKAALQAIRKASPFPPIPDGAGRSSWEFSIPLAFRR